MSRINMKIGITVDQVIEARNAFNELGEMNTAAENNDSDAMLSKAENDLIGVANAVETILGGDHIITRRINDAATRCAELSNKISEKKEQHDAKIAKLAAKVNSYSGWFVMVGTEKIPVTRALIIDGMVYHGGEMNIFIPVYMPNEVYEAVPPTLFDQE